MLDAPYLIQKHRARGVLIDTNLLVLFFVGATNRKRIKDFKRTQAYTAEDFDLLARLIGWFGKVHTTPHVLTEVSNLTDLPRREERNALREIFKKQVLLMEECFEESCLLVNHATFHSFGLTDAAVIALKDRSMLVMTDDLDLQLALDRRGVDTLNFNHIRASGWS